VQAVSAGWLVSRRRPFRGGRMAAGFGKPLREEGDEAGIRTVGGEECGAQFRHTVLPGSLILSVARQLFVTMEKPGSLADESPTSVTCSHTEKVPPIAPLPQPVSHELTNFIIHNDRVGLHELRRRLSNEPARVRASWLSMIIGMLHLSLVLTCLCSPFVSIKQLLMFQETRPPPVPLRAAYNRVTDLMLTMGSDTFVPMW